MDPEMLSGIEREIWAAAFVLYRRNQSVSDGWVDATYTVLEYRAERELRKEEKGEAVGEG